MKTLGAAPDSLEKLRQPEGRKTDRHTEGERGEGEGRDGRVGGREREQPRDLFPIRNFVFSFDPDPLARLREIKFR